jgi:hypothetical protein
MPGRMFYSGDPTPLEGALAQQVASGTSPFAGALLTGYATQRQVNAQNLNQMQQQQYLMGLQSALQVERLKAQASILGSQAKGGHGLGSMMEAANTGGLGTYDPSDIARERALGTAGEVAGIAKNVGEASNAASQAGTPIDLNSLNGIAPGILTYGQGTPRDITKEGMGNRTAIEVAQINAAAKLKAAGMKGSGGSKEVPLKGADTFTLGGHTFTASGPLDEMTKRLSPEEQSQVQKGVGAATVQEGHNKLDTHDASGDTPQQDPDLPEQKAALTAAGYTLLNGHGDPKPHTQNGKVGKKFVVTDVNGVTSEQFVPNRHQ